MVAETGKKLSKSPKTRKAKHRFCLTSSSADADCAAGLNRYTEPDTESGADRASPLERWGEGSEEAAVLSYTRLFPGSKIDLHPVAWTPSPVP